MSRSPTDPALNFNPGADLTIDAWVRPTLDDGDHPIVDKRIADDLHARGYYLYLQQGFLAFQFLDGSFPLGPHVDTTTHIANGKWHHVAVTLNRNRAQGGTLYVDGIGVHTFGPVFPAIGPAETVGIPLRIGHNHDAFMPPWFFKGLIDEVEIFDRALLPDEIKSIFLAGSRGKCRPCPSIRVSQESAPGLGDFDDHVLGCIDVFGTSYSPPDYYEWDDPFDEVPYPTSFSNTEFPLTDDRSHLFLVAGTGDGLSLFIVHDKPETSPGGRAEMSFEVVGDLTGVVRTVADDPTDTYTTVPFGPGASASKHNWSPCCTDGLVLTGLDGNWSMFVEFTEYAPAPGPAVIQGLDSWFAYSADGSLIGLALEEDRRVRLDCCAILPPPCGGCPTDTNADGDTDAADLAELLADWGDVPLGNCLDSDQDGEINSADLAELLAAWGACL